MDIINLIIKTEYAGKPKDYMKSKTELETINVNGTEKQKRTHIVCYVVKAVATIYALFLHRLLNSILWITSMKN